MAQNIEKEHLYDELNEILADYQYKEKYNKDDIDEMIAKVSKILR
jgi:hypothetical protein